VTCIADNVGNPPGEFVWIVGGEEQENDDRVRQTQANEDGTTFQQTLEIDTDISMDNTEVECQYIQRDATTGDILSTHSDTLNLRITYEEWPAPEGEAFDAGTFEEGKPAMLTVPLKLYPEPTELYWSITFEDGTEIQVLPGGTGDSNHFKAHLLEKVGENEFTASLMLDRLTRKDAATTFVLNVQLNEIEPHQIPVTFATALESITQASIPLTETSPDGSVAKMSVGIWIIVAIIIIIIVIIIAYCIYRKKCGNEDTDGYANPPDQHQQQQATAAAAGKSNV